MEVAADSGHGISAGTRQIMEKGFLFDGIDIFGDEFLVDQGIENSYNFV